MAARVGMRAWSLAAVCAVAVAPTSAFAQGKGAMVGFQEIRPFVISVVPVGRGGAVGGGSVDARGLLARARPEAAGDLQDAWRQALQPVADDLMAESPLRKVSLARLQAALVEAIAG